MAKVPKEDHEQQEAARRSIERIKKRKNPPPNRPGIVGV